MGLTSVLTAANSGLRLSQAGLEVVARNIANADSPGYTRKTLLSGSAVHGLDVGVREIGVVRAINTFLQTQLRGELAASAATETRAEFLGRMDAIFGAPGEENAFDTVVARFAESLQLLTASPDSHPAREAAVADAQFLAQHLNQLSIQVQQLRQLAEDSIDQSVSEVNDSLQQLDRINEQLALLDVADVPPADLLDERDKFLDKLAEHLDIHVTTAENGSVTVATVGGVHLLQDKPARLEFDHHGGIGPASLYSNDASERGVGTVRVFDGNGYAIDLIQDGGLIEGRIGALVELRDETLVQAQTQLDEFAHALALSFSSKDVAGVPAVVGVQAGFDLEVANLQPGNAISLTYTQTPPGIEQRVTIVRVDDATQLPLSNDYTPDPDDTVIGIDFSGGVAPAAAAIQAALGSGVAVSNPSGSILRVLDDGAAGTTDIDALSAVVTATQLQDDGLQLPLFVDGFATPYTASLEDGSQKVGFAARIGVSLAVRQNSELLVRYATSPQTPIGDVSRPMELLARLTERAFAFSPSTGIGNTDQPYSGSVASFAGRVIQSQATQADAAARKQAAHEIVITSLRDRMQQESGVNIDQELSNLITLQNAFAANARVIQVANELMQLLFGV